MKGNSHRIPVHAQGNFGTRINRSRPVSFRFDRQRLVGVTGDTLSSALLANGITTFGINARTHHPQGFFSLLDHSTPRMISLERGNLFIPEPDPNDVGLREGLSVRSTNNWKSYLAGYSRFLKRFSIFDTVPPLPLSEMPENFEHIHMRVDVLIIGGGLAGITAAELPAEDGLDVLVVEASPFLGGISDAYDGQLDGLTLETWIKKKAAELAEKENVTIRPLMTVIHLSAEGEAIILERISSTGLEKSSPETVRARLWFVKAQTIVLATGAYERNLTFQDNAAVGVISACSARLMLRRYGIAIGRHVVFACSSDEGLRTALDYKQVGIAIEQLVDLRLHPAGILLDQVKAEGIRLAFGAAPYKVSQTRRGNDLDSLTLRNRLRDDDGPAVEREVLCDTIITSGGWQPNLHLARSIGADFSRDDETGCVTIGYHPSGFYSVGAASGIYNVREVVQDALKAGADIVASLKRRAAPSYVYRDIDCTVIEDTPPEYIPPLVENGPKDRAFVNERRSITLQDIAYDNDPRAARDQAHGFYHDEESRFLKPVGLAVLAGIPKRQSASRSLGYAAVKGAVHCNSAGWKTADCYIRGDENPEQAIARELRCLPAKPALHIIDHAQLVSISGEHAHAFVAYLQTVSTTISSLQEHASCFALNGILVHQLEREDNSLLCFAMPGGACLYSHLLKARETFGLQVALIPEEERFAKWLFIGEHADTIIPSSLASWQLSLTSLPVHLALCPIGHAKSVWETLLLENISLLGTKAFEQLLFEHGDLTGEQYHHFSSTGGTLIGLLPEDPHFHIPTGSHLFAGIKPASNRKLPSLGSRSGYVLASCYSYRLGRQISLAVTAAPLETDQVYFRTRGDFWQARAISPDFSHSA